MDEAISLVEVSKQFGATRALAGVSTTVARGELVGLLGRNGAGKTTLIRIATGLYAADSGRVRVAGLDPRDGSREFKRRIGVMPDDGGMLDRLTGLQYLGFVGAMFGLDRATIAARCAELFDQLDLRAEPGALICDYSFGMKKKVALAAALIHGPQVVFLDEPFEGLDALTARTLKQILAGLCARGTTVLLSSHALDTVERLCPRVVIIDAGRVVADGAPDALQAAGGGERSLEALFVELMGGAKAGGLSWL
jgi:ABC-2 type transport system ATP-binding protein